MAGLWACLVPSVQVEHKVYIFGCSNIVAYFQMVSPAKELSRGEESGAHIHAS